MSVRYELRNMCSAWHQITTNAFDMAVQYVFIYQKMHEELQK